jgi:benzoate membrane transport protein
VAGRTRYRDAAVVTFLVTASGTTFGGIGSPFWGLLAGLVLVAILNMRLTRRVLASPSDAR